MNHLTAIASTCRRWIMNVLISLDQLANSILAGDPDETISSRLGRIKAKHGGRIPWTRPVAAITARVLNGLLHNHTTHTIEPHRGARGIYDKPTTTDREPTRPNNDGDHT